MRDNIGHPRLFEVEKGLLVILDEGIYTVDLFYCFIASHNVYGDYVYTGFSDFSGLNLIYKASM